MPTHRRTPRRLAALLAVAVVGSACSSADMEATEQEVELQGGGVADELDGDAADASIAEEPEGAPQAATADGLRSLAGELVDDAILFEPEGPAPVPVAPVVVNPFEDTAEDPLSTFALDVDTASWTQTLFWLERGQRPPPSIVRPEEFLNWFDYGYPAPADGWAIHVDGVTAAPWDPGTALLRVGLVTATVEPRDRPDATMTFVVDTSGSMAGAPLATVKQTLLLLVEQLRPTDRIGLVAYGSTAEVLLEPTPLSESDELVRAIEGLETNGSTYVQDGLELGYELATRFMTPNGVNAVVLASDGVANVGITDVDGLLGRIDEGVRAGVHLLALGVTDGQFNDHLMEQLADRGNGAAYFVRDVDDARRLFVDNLESTFVVVAEDSKVQVELDPAVVLQHRLIGYENRAVADDDFRNDAVDAGEVGAGHEVTAVYELVLAPDAPAGAELGTVRLRWQDPRSRDVAEVSRPVTLADLVPNAETRFGTAVQAAVLAELLRGSPYVAWTLDDAAAFGTWGVDPAATTAVERARDASPAPGS